MSHAATPPTSLLPRRGDTLSGMSSALTSPSSSSSSGSSTAVEHLGEDEFAGSARFEIARRLGTGTFGIVYEAHDRERRAQIALKVLRRKDPRAIYQFKKEFRALADVSHPNLVSLYELVAEGDRLLFTMEIVRGKPFVEHVRRGAPRVLTAPPTSGTRLTPSITRRVLAVDVERLRGCVRQLADGLIALHRAEKLHRDIKPSNVLVTEEGRVVLLDFGLAVDQREGDRSSMTVDGSPAYMAPEQALGEAREASDWYAVGVMLYEALTGELPFRGDAADVLAEKQQREPLPPSATVNGVPPDLDALCSALLRRLPEARPRGSDVLRALARPSRPPPPMAAPRERGDEPRFVGREHDLAALDAAYDRVAGGASVTVVVIGRSGMGKSALVQRFIDDLRARERRAVILSGRCYEQEELPHKALDALIDALTQHLRKLPPSYTASLLPKDLPALARLFPVLRRVPSVSAAAIPGAGAEDLREVRRRAFAALRELLARLARRVPVVLFIDDLQWGDVDSARLLVELLRPLLAPPLMLIVAARLEDLASAPVRELRGGLRAAGYDDVRDVEVGPLAPHDARALALDRLGLDGEGAAQRAAEIAGESRGAPLFIAELARHVRQEDTPLRAGATDLDHGSLLDEVIRSRIAALPVPARRLLEIVAVAGSPIARVVAREAAELTAHATLEPAALMYLRSGHLLRATGARDEDVVEAYHDRVRAVVMQGLPPADLAARHLALARALDAWGKADPERLATHFRAGGEDARAAAYMEEAAINSFQALAFERAARLYRAAADLRQGELAMRRGLLVRLGDAEASAGRGGEAAAAYLAAAAGATRAELLELTRRAAGEYLYSGRVEDGVRVLRGLLAALGARASWSALGALVVILLWRARRTLSGLSFRARDPSRLAAAELLRIDAFGVGAKGLLLVDPLRGAAFHARHLTMALGAGEPERAFQALATEAIVRGARGPRKRRAATRALREARSVATTLGDPYRSGTVALVEGAVSMLAGEFRGALAPLAHAEQIFREQCRGVTWEHDTAQNLRLLALVQAGSVRELAELLAAYVRDAEQRGDVYAHATARARAAPFVLLARGAPDRAELEVRQAIHAWSPEGFQVVHFFGLLARTDIALYRGDAEGAHGALRADEVALRRSGMLRIQMLRILYWDARARAAVAMRMRCEAGVARARLCSEATPWSDGLADLVLGQIEELWGSPARGRNCLQRARVAFEKAGMKLHAAVTRGSKDERDGFAGWDERIQDPRAMARVLAPGLALRGPGDRS